MVVVGGSGISQVIQAIEKISTVAWGNLITVDGQVTLGFVAGNDTVVIVCLVAVMVVTVKKVKEVAVNVVGVGPPVVFGGAPPAQVILTQPILKTPTVEAGNEITVDEQVTLGFVVGNDTVIAVGSVAVMVVTVEKVTETAVEPSAVGVDGVVVGGRPPPL